MIKDLTFFEDAKELEELTGLSHEELWDNGFNLDDMDWGFVVEGDDWFVKKEYHWAEDTRRKYNEYGKDSWYLTDQEKRLMEELLKDPMYDVEYEYELNYDKKIPYYLDFLLSQMANYCVGYHPTTYNGKTYVTLHHA